METVTQQITHTTEQVVAEMLRENTGSVLVDSGDLYGRAYERNQTTDFAQQPAAWGRFDCAGSHLHVNGTVSLYHWMTSMLEFDPVLQEMLDRHAQGASNSESWFTVVDDFASKLFQAGELDSEPTTIYTYNSPDSCDLSQNIQYVNIYADGNYEPSHMIVMVHNGCDARWGFTAPKCFRIKSDEDYLDAMRLSGVYAGDDSWYITSWNTSEPSERNACKVDLRGLFTMDLTQALGQITPDDVRGLLEGAEYAKQRLNATTLTDEQKEKSRKIIDFNTAELRDAARTRCVKTLAAEHAWFVLVDNGKAWLFSDEAESFADGEEFGMFSDYV